MEGVDKASVEARVISIVIDNFVDESADHEITRETSFFNDLNADSLDTVEFVMALEEEFDLEIPDEVTEKITTVGEAVDEIMKVL